MSKLKLLDLPPAVFWQGCGDSSCYTRPQTGMCTNGGCRCHSRPNHGEQRKAFQQLYQDREYFRTLASELSQKLNKDEIHDH
jgi:hypothetical protein